jgi:WD40 repeat protein
MRLARTYVSSGTQCLDAGDSFGALLWFVEALAMEEHDASRAEIHRMRIGALLQHSPKLVQYWLLDKPTASTEFSLDARRVLVLGQDSVAHILDVRTGSRVTAPLKLKYGMSQAKFSPDGRYVLTVASPPAAPGPAPTPAWDSDKNEDRDPEMCEVRVWDATTGQPIGPPLRHRNLINRAAFSPGSKQLVTASQDQTARVWNLPSGDPTMELRHDHAVDDASFSSDGRYILTTSGLSERSKGHPAPAPLGLVPPPTTSGERPKESASTRVWNAATGELVAPPLTYADSVRRVVSAPDGRRILTLGDDRSAQVWDSITGKAITPMLHTRDGLETGAFSPNGQVVVTGGGSSGGFLFVSNPTGESRVCDLETNELGPVLEHNGPVRCVSFAPDNGYFVTASDDGTAKVWGLSDKPIVFPHQGAVRHASFSCDGRLVLTASDRTVRVWDLAGLAPPYRPLTPGGGVRHASFSPDGGWVVTAHEDKTARVWNTGTGTERLPQVVLIGLLFGVEGTGGVDLPPSQHLGDHPKIVNRSLLGV